MTFEHEESLCPYHSLPCIRQVAVLAVTSHRHMHIGSHPSVEKLLLTAAFFHLLLFASIGRLLLRSDASVCLVHGRRAFHFCSSCLAPPPTFAHLTSSSIARIAYTCSRVIPECNAPCCCCPQQYNCKGVSLSHRWLARWHLPVCAPLLRKVQHDGTRVLTMP